MVDDDGLKAGKIVADDDDDDDAAIVAIVYVGMCVIISIYIFCKR